MRSDPISDTRPRPSGESLGTGCHGQAERTTVTGTLRRTLVHSGSEIPGRAYGRPQPAPMGWSSTIDYQSNLGVAMPKAEWTSRVERIDKPWGFETHFALVPGKYCGKTLHVDAGHALSLQYHVRKEETIAVQSGKLLFEVGTAEGSLESFELLPGEAVHLSPGTRHRMTALVDTVVLEASTTELDDVVRIEDRYGREIKDASSKRM